MIYDQKILHRIYFTPYLYQIYQKNKYNNTMHHFKINNNNKNNNNTVV